MSKPLKEDNDNNTGNLPIIDMNFKNHKFSQENINISNPLVFELNNVSQQREINNNNIVFDSSKEFKGKIFNVIHISNEGNISETNTNFDTNLLANNNIEINSENITHTNTNKRRNKKKKKKKNYQI